MVLVSYEPLKKYGSIKTIVCVFELAVVRRLLHAGLGDIHPLRGEPHDHGGVYHGIVLRGRRAARTLIKCLNTGAQKACQYRGMCAESVEYCLSVAPSMGLIPPCHPGST